MSGGAERPHADVIGVVLLLYSASDGMSDGLETLTFSTLEVSPSLVYDEAETPHAYEMAVVLLSYGASDGVSDGLEGLGFRP